MLQTETNLRFNLQYMRGEFNLCGTSPVSDSKSFLIKQRLMFSIKTWFESQSITAAGIKPVGFPLFILALSLVIILKCLHVCWRWIRSSLVTAEHLRGQDIIVCYSEDMFMNPLMKDACMKIHNLLPSKVKHLITV